MPIEYDRTPGGANKKQRRRNGELPEKQKTPEPRVDETLRVRMLRSFTLDSGTFKTGDTVRVPIITARSWIGFGLAEQDKSLDGPPETK